MNKNVCVGGGGEASPAHGGDPEGGGRQKYCEMPLKSVHPWKGEGHYHSRKPAESCIVIMLFVWHCFSIFVLLYLTLLETKKKENMPGTCMLALFLCTHYGTEHRDVVKDHPSSECSWMCSNWGWSLALVKAGNLANFYEANVIQLGAFGVRHILLSSPPSPVLALLKNSPCSLLSINIDLKQNVLTATMSKCLTEHLAFTEFEPFGFFLSINVLFFKVAFLYVLLHINYS